MLVIAAVGTTVNTPPDTLQPQDFLNLRIEISAKEWRRPAAERPSNDAFTSKMPLSVRKPEEQPGIR
jgi:hypothetical protein